jgi:hypothetical protein
MKRISLLILVFVMSGFALLTRAQVDVTFQVDMSEVAEINPDGVTVAGDFQQALGNPNNWEPGVVFLTEGNPGIYSVTVQLPAGTYYFKYINGTSWADPNPEQISGPCSYGGNRQVIVGAEPVVLEPVCFGSCTVCNPPTAQVTFQVNMANEDISPDGVFIAGSFTEWAQTEMTLESGSVYSYTTDLAEGNSYSYKFLNGPDGWENVPGGCNQNGDRFLTVPAGGVTLDPVCFASCVDCEAPTVEVTFQVDMSNEEVSANGVHIAGSFQGDWNPGTSQMIDAGNGIYTYVVSFSQGETVFYKFINGNDWSFSEVVPADCGVDDGYGGYNRTLVAPAENTVLDPVCFGSCEACEAPPAPGGGMETFDNSNATGSYADGNFIGNNGIEWFYYHSRDDGGYPIEGKCLMLRRASDSKLESGLIPGGIGSFSMQMRKAYTATAPRQLELYINGDLMGTSIEFGTASGADPTIHVFEVADINIAGDFIMMIKNVGSTTTNRQTVIDNISWTALGGLPNTAFPSFSHPAGDYLSPFDLEITSATEGASIYYTLNGDDPDDNSTIYTGPIEISETTTVKAIAYADGFNPSAIAEATFTFPVINEVNNLGELRAAFDPENQGQYFRVLGEIVLTYQQTFRNQKFLQDATGGILIDDTPGVVTTSYELYDGITNLFGTVSEFGGMLQFVPVEDPGAATSSENVIVPEVVTLDELFANFEEYESELVQVVDVTFANPGAVFANGVVYPISDASGEGLFRTTFYDMDYIGAVIPPIAIDVVGIPNSRSDGEYISSRDGDLVIPDYLLIVNPQGGEQFEQGTTVEISWSSNVEGVDVSIELYSEETKSVEVLAEALPIEQGTFVWEVGETAVGDFYQIAISTGEKSLFSITPFFSIVYPFDVKITEIMYNPPEGGSDTLEFIEFYNNGQGAINMFNWAITDGVEFTFPEYTLNPGEYVVVSTNQSAFFNTFGLEVFEWTSGGLSNGGETIELSDPIGNVRASVDYDDGGDWPGEPDGEGPSLEFCDPSLENDDPANWSVSTKLAAINADGEGIYCTPMAGCNQDNVLAVLYPDGWNGISGNLEPGKISLEDLFAPAYGNLVILFNQQGIFWPDYNVNTIGDWNPYDGYKVKFDGSTYFVFSGTEVANKVYNFEPGVAFLPVLSSNPVLVEDVIVPLESSVKVMFDFSTGYIYWPEGGIVPGVTGALEVLNPGFSYLTLFTNTGTIDFDVALPKSVQVQKPVFSNNTTWNDVLATGDQHIISIAVSALNELQTGDVVGVFNSEDLCVGMAEYSVEGQPLPLVVYGNDFTTEAVDGMIEGENLNFKVYRNGEEMEVLADYNPAIQNHDGMFAHNGLSMVTAFKSGATGINGHEISYSIYPNPGNGIFNINVDGNFDVMVSNAQGQIVFSGNLDGSSQLNLSTQPKGIYFIRLTNTAGSIIEKVIIR